MNGYVLSPAARGDMDDIWAYTAQTWSIDQAEDYVFLIRDACSALASGDRIGQAAHDVRPGYRKLRVGSHVLFYRSIDASLIDIVRILHQQMDIPARF